MAKEQEKKQEQKRFMYQEGTPLAYHANMQMGNFAPFGDAEKAVRKMKIHLIGWRFFEAMLYVKPSKLEEELNKLLKDGIEQGTAEAKVIKDNTKQWVELFFVKDFDAKSTTPQPICSMLLKTYSLQNFANEIKKFIYEIKENGEQCTPHDVVLELKTTQKTKGNATFYVVEFTSQIADPKDVEFIAENTKDFLLYDESNLRECLRNVQTYVPNNKIRNVNPPQEFKALFLTAPKQIEAEIETTEA